jgi:hypothetical protein
MEINVYKLREPFHYPVFETDRLNEWELQDIVGRFCCEKGHQTNFENTAASSLIHLINLVMTE